MHSKLGSFGRARFDHAYPIFLRVVLRDIKDQTASFDRQELGLPLAIFAYLSDVQIFLYENIKIKNQITFDFEKSGGLAVV